MFRKKYLTLLIAVALFMTGSIAVLAQTAPVMGRVVMKKADGTTAPVADAVIDVYRLDIKGKLPAGKTNGKGEFSFAGFPLGGQFVFAVSAPGAKAEIFPGVKAGNEKITITLVEGDGKRLTEDEARGALNAAPTTAKQSGELTAEQKKAQAEYEKQVADVKAKNAKSTETDALIRKIIEEGKKAFEEKNYDLAIAKFDEGIAADPDFAGSTPVLLNNKTAALINRATATYNQSVKADQAAKTAGLAAVKKDFEDAAAASDRALTILQSATAPDANVQKNYDANKFQALSNRKEVYRLMGKTGVNRTKGKEALAAYQEYLAVETDAKKKSDSQIMLAEVLQDSNEFDLAIVEFEKVLAADPNNADALAGISLSLVNVGFVTSVTDAAKGKEQLQQAANYLQKFLDVAPETHKYKAEAKGIIETLKKEQNVTPTKSTKGSSTKKKT